MTNQKEKTISTRNYKLERELDLVPGHEYQIVLEDGYGDGLAFHNGYVKVFAVVNDEEKILFFKDGKYRKVRPKFTVPDF